MKERRCLICRALQDHDVHRGNGQMKLDKKDAAFVRGEPFFLHPFDPGDRRQGERREGRLPMPAARRAS